MAPLASPNPLAEANALAALGPSERTLVELVAVFFDATTVTSITRAFGKLGHRIGGRSPKNDGVLLVLRSLVERGILTGDHRFAVADGLAHRVALDAARGGGLSRMAEIVRELVPARKAPDEPISTWTLGVRELRIELYARRWDAARALARELPRHIFHEVCSPFDRVWLEELPTDLRGHALAGVVETATTYLEPADEAFAMLEAEPALTDQEHRILVEQLVLRGRFDDAERQLAGRTSIEADVGRAFLSLLRGKTAEAIAAYEAAHATFLKMAGKRVNTFPDRAGLFFVVAVLAEGNASSLARATRLTDAAKSSHPLQGCYAMLSEVLSVFAGRAEPDGLVFIGSVIDLAHRDPIEILLKAAAASWVHTKLPGEARAALETRRARAEAAGLRWCAVQAADLLAGVSGKATSARSDIDGARLATLVSPRERWAEVLGALAEIASSKNPAKPAGSAPQGDPDHRLAWIVRKHPYGIMLEPREQVRAKGGWSKGKPVAFKRLFEEAKRLAYLTSSDLAACATIKGTTTYEYFGRYPRTDYALDDARALLALAGSANVIIEVEGGTFEPCEIRQAAPRLEVKRDGGRLALSLVPRPRSDEETLAILDSGPRAVEIVVFAPIHHAIARALGTKPLEVPSAGEAQLRAALLALSGRVAVQADL